MNNRNVGYAFLGIALIMIIIVFLFNSTLYEIHNTGCSMEKALCPMNKTIDQQTYLSLTLVAILIIISFILIFSKPDERVVIKKIKDKKIEKNFNLSGFNKDEKQVFNLVKDNGAVFQADLIEKTEFGKAKMSRIIDRLEGHNLVERKRRGMTNVVVLKED